MYDYEYIDTQAMPVEVEEWFSYSDLESTRLKQCKLAFNEEWRSANGKEQDWVDVTEDVRRQFVSKQLRLLGSTDQQEKAIRALLILTYIILGVWEETAGRQDGTVLTELFPDSEHRGSRIHEYQSSNLQLQWIVAMVDTLHACDALQIIYSILQTVAKRDFEAAPSTFESSFRNEPQARRPDESVELWCCLTILIPLC